MTTRHGWLVMVVVVSCATGKPGLRYSDVIAPLQPMADDAAPLLTHADVLAMRVPTLATLLPDPPNDNDLDRCVRADAMRDSALMRSCIQVLRNAATHTDDRDAVVAAAVMLRGMGLGSDVQQDVIEMLRAIEQQCPHGCAGTRAWFGFMAWQMRQRLDVPGQPTAPGVEHQGLGTDSGRVRTSTLEGRFVVDANDRALLLDTGTASQLWLRSTGALQWGDESPVRTRSWQARRVLRPGTVRVAVEDDVDVIAFDDSGQPVSLGTPKPTNASATTAPLLLNDDSPLHTMIRGRAGWPGDDQLTLHLARQLMARPITATTLSLVIDVLEDDGGPSRAELNALLLSSRQRLLEAVPSHPTVLLANAREQRAISATDALPAFRALVVAQPRYVVGLQAYLELLTELRLWDEALTATNILLAIDHTRSTLRLCAQVLEQAGHGLEARALLREQDTDEQRHLAARAAGQLSQVPSSLVEQWSSPWRGLPDALWWDDGEALRSLLEQRAAKRSDGAELDRWAMAPVELRAKSLIHAPASLRAIDWQEAIGSIDGRNLDDARKVAIARRRAGGTPAPEQPMVRLLRNRELQLQPDGSAYVLHHELVEVRSKEAISALGEVSVGEQQRLLRWAVHKPDGRLLHAERPAGISDLALPGLAPFDIVELATLTAYGPHQDGHREVRWLWDDAITTFMDTMTIRTPSSLAKRVRVDGEPVDAGCDQGWCEVKRQAADHAAKPNEPFALTQEGRAVVVTVVAPTGNDAAPTVLRLKRQQRSQLTDGDRLWLREVGMAMMGTSTKPVDVAQRISAHLATMMEPSGNRDPASSLVRGEGHAASVFGALLEALQIDHERWLLHRPGQGDWKLSSSPFEVVFFRVDEQLFAFDGSLVAMGALPMAWRGAVGLRVDGAEALPTELPLAWFDTRPTTLRVDLKLDRAVGLRGMVVFEPGELAGDWLRQQLRTMTDEQLRTLLEQLLQPQLPGLRITEVLVPALRRPDQPFAIGCAVDISIEGDEVRFEHLWSQGALASIRADLPLAAFDLPGRQWPMWMSASDELLEFQLQLPSDATFTDIPPPLRHQGAWSVDQSAYVDNGTLFWQRRLSRRGQRVEPEQWPAMHADLLRTMAGMDGKVVFQLDAPAKRLAVGAAATR
jgi:hypothetical protein